MINTPQLFAFHNRQKLFKIKQDELALTQKRKHINRTDKKPGVLLLHGYSATPYSMHLIFDALVEHGFHVLAPLLAGHGSTVEAFAASTWKDWLTSAEDGLNELASDTNDLYVAGISMGGALSLNLAAKFPQIKRLFLLAPAVFPPWVLKHGYLLIQALSHLKIVTDIPTKGGDIIAPNRYDYQYGCN